MPVRTAALILALGLHSPTPAADLPETKLAPMPDICLRARPPVDKGKAAQIRALIARLADVSRPGVGYSQTFGGSDFLPVPGHVRARSLTWTDNGLEDAPALRDLVAIGPDALPFLLAALGDDTRTKLTFRHRGTRGVFREGETTLSDELPGNPLNPREVGVIDPPGRAAGRSGHVETYTVKVGDLCLVAVGQIVGRPYTAARYQMTSCTVLNSPVEDAVYRGRVRSIWAPGDPTRTLFESLWTDYRTTGMPRGPDRVGSNFGSRFQTGAVVRLLYYFPDESAPVIAARLNGLDVGKAAEGSGEGVRQVIANGGVWADELVEAAAWCTEPTVRAAVRGIFRRTTDVGVFTAAVGAFGGDEAGAIVEKANELIAGLTTAERRDGAAYHILGVTAERAGAATAPAFRRAIATAGPAELGHLAGAFSRAKGDWPLALLKPLLDDQRPTARDYYVRDGKRDGPVLPSPIPVGGEDGYRKVPVRVCDAAAEGLAAVLPGERGRFPAEHDRPTLDRYIARLKEKIAAK